MRTPFVFLILMSLAFVGGCGSKFENQPIPPGASVLAIGDSVTFGTGAGMGKDFPSQLALRTGWVIHNRGIPGDTSEGVNRRINEVLIDVRPELVLLEIGGNDFIRRISNSEVKENIRAVLKKIKAQGIPVVMIAVPQFSPLGVVFGQLPDASLYAELAAEENVRLIPDVFADVLSDNRLKADTIHPNEDGYEKMAEGIAEALAAMHFTELR